MFFSSPYLSTIYQDSSIIGHFQVLTAGTGEFAAWGISIDTRAGCCSVSLDDILTSHAKYVYLIQFLNHRIPAGTLKPAQP